MLPDAALFDQRRATPVPAPVPPVERPEPAGPRQGLGPRRRIAGRRVQRTVRHVDVWSVFKLSIFYYACFTILWLVLVAVVYGFLAHAGLFDAIQKFGKAMVLWDKVNISLIYVEKWALLFAIAFLIVGSLINALIAVLYNFAADTVGGIEMTFVEKDI